MLKNYFIAAIRAIRRSPWEAILKIFAIATGVSTSVIHFAFWYSGDFANFPELITSLVLILLCSALLLQFYGQPQNNREYKLRVILGDEDLLMRGRKIADAGLIIFGGVILGLVLSDSFFTYVKPEHLSISNREYLAGVLILGFAHFTVFLFTVWFGSGVVIRNNSEIFFKLSKWLAGALIFITSMAAIFWSLMPGGEIAFMKIYLFDVTAISFFSYVSWNKLAYYTLESKGRYLSIMKLQGASTFRILFYWIQQLGPAALISVGVSLLIGNLYLFFEMPFNNGELATLITFSWAAFISAIIILGLSNAIARGFEQESGGFQNS